MVVARCLRFRKLSTHFCCWFWWSNFRARFFVSWGAGVGGGGGLGLMFAGYAPLASQGPYLVIVYSVANNRQICNFRDPNLVTFYFYELTHFFRLNEEHFAFHDLQYKHSGTFANR